MLKKIESLIKGISSIGTISTFILTIISLIIGKKIENPEGLLDKVIKFLFEYRVDIWVCFVSFSIIYFFIYALKINRLFTLGFKDNFKSNLDENWDYSGDWRITENNELFITNSDSGGITKKGARWENYTITFDAKIINLCIGVILRATDQNNYYMFQINHEKVRPHRRVSVPIIKTTKSSMGSDEFTIANYRVGWQVMDNFSVDHKKKLDNWFKVKIRVYGQTISIYIDNDLVFQRDSFLEIPIGKIGFRNYDIEQAIIKNLKVIIN